MRAAKTAMAGTLLTALLAAGCAGQGPAATTAAPANATAFVPQVPQAIRLSHENLIEELTELSRRRGAVGAAARKALPVLRAHFQREEEYIMPPLSLAHALADGKISPDMRWAVAMADRIKANRDAIFHEHSQITEAMNELLVAAEHAHDKAAEEFARSSVADSLEDMEIAEPAAIVIGEYLRLRLPPQ